MMTADLLPTIPVFRPHLGERDLRNAEIALAKGDISGTSGYFIEQFEQEFAAYCGAKHAVALSSGSTALHLACVLADIRPGDEVIVSASTNIATANAVVQCGGIVVPVDSFHHTWNMNYHDLQEAITPRTKAIIPVHLYGQPVDMDPVMEIAREHGLTVIEDAAEAHGATYKARKTGSLGDMGCFSFYANKVVTTGEGGMLTTNYTTLADRARSLRNLAFTTPRFHHYECGYNYRMTNLQAAIGCGQMSRIEQIVKSKRDLAERYRARLDGTKGVQYQDSDPACESVHWMFAIRLGVEYPISRDWLMEHLATEGIESRTAFCPMNLQPALLRTKSVKPTSCPVAERLWKDALYLPSDPYLTDAELDRICAVVRRR